MTRHDGDIVFDTSARGVVTRSIATPVPRISIASALRPICRDTPHIYRARQFMYFSSLVAIAEDIGRARYFIR